MNTMMMECPRCGFAQPKDQFCASCGLDVDQYIAKPKPLLIRILQNSNLHLSLIAVAVVSIIGFIIYTQSTVVSRQLGNLLDLPLSSRDAADPDDSPAPSPARQARGRGGQETAEDADESEVAQTASMAGAAEAPEATEPSGGGAAAGASKIPTDAVKLTSSQKFELMHWEVPKEALANLLALAEKVGDGTGGRAYYYPTGQKIREEIQNVGRRLSQGRSIAVQAGEAVTVETPPTTTEAFQIGLFFQLSKVADKELSLKWESSLILPQPESPQEAASTTPGFRATAEASLNGTATLTSSGLFVIVLDPPNRAPREEYLARAGEGPWAVFTSPEFRAGLTDWVVLASIR